MFSRGKRIRNIIFDIQRRLNMCEMRKSLFLNDIKMVGDITRIKSYALESIGKIEIEIRNYEKRINKLMGKKNVKQSWANKIVLDVYSKLTKKTIMEILNG